MKRMELFGWLTHSAIPRLQNGVLSLPNKFEWRKKCILEKYVKRNNRWFNTTQAAYLTFMGVLWFQLTSYGCISLPTLVIICSWFYEHPQLHTLIGSVDITIVPRALEVFLSEFHGSCIFNSPVSKFILCCLILFPKGYIWHGHVCNCLAQILSFLVNLACNIILILWFFK